MGSLGLGLGSIKTKNYYISCHESFSPHWASSPAQAPIQRVKVVFTPIFHRQLWFFVVLVWTGDTAIRRRPYCFFSGHLQPSPDTNASP